MATKGFAFGNHSLLKKAGENFTFVLRDMKLNKVQFPWFVRGFCKRKAPC